MPKCKKAKNPCKICQKPVSHKSGLQCRGVCECWFHYICLECTPARIKDIKAGIIRVICPSPNCKTTIPKEHLIDETYCYNIPEYPDNRSVKCEPYGKVCKKHSHLNLCLGVPSTSLDIPGDYRRNSMEVVPSLRAIEQMCETVGQLTNKLNCLMNKMKQNIEDTGVRGGVASGGKKKFSLQKKQKRMGPKPCNYL